MPAAVAARTKDELESLLRLRKLDHTLSVFPAAPATNDLGAPCVRAIPTGLAELDARLRGGLPRGQLSECIGPRSSGRLAMVLSAMARATARGEAVALVDPLDMFDPMSAAASGVDFSRMLWVRGEATSSSRVGLSCEYGTQQKSVDRGVKALNLILQAGGFGLVVLDLAEVAPSVLRRLPFATWLRLHRVIDGSDTACVLMGSEPIARSAAGVTVQLGLGKARVMQKRQQRAMEEMTDVCVPVSAAAC